MAEGFSRKQGFWSAALAYGMWGILPIYWKLLSDVDPLQILAHRILWAAVFCLVLLAGTKDMKSLRDALSTRKNVVLVFCAALLVTLNWGLYIYAVTSGHVIESALGYYINPLLSVVLGGLFFRERIDRWTGVAVGIAAISIVAAGLLYGKVPWLSLLLAITFALYGATKKKLNFPPITSLALETFFATPFALVFLAVIHAQGGGAFVSEGLGVSILLALAGVVTAIPLLLFGVAATSISLQFMAFLQYITPTAMLLLGLFAYGEEPSRAIVVAFAGVLVAVIIFTATRIQATRAAGKHV
ncbi:MAG: EamA family transporter RarD [Rectinema sp.]